LGLELSNATSSICWIFVPLFDEAHNPKVVGSNPTPATKFLKLKAGSVRTLPAEIPSLFQMRIISAAAKQSSARTLGS